ncbi:MAG: efflux RND transporter permease subunit [Firmicutes bacterium]|nr:efflux RND transporter permease subunit [Bacillota bacterium]
MFAKFSVKKPLTVFVAVMVVLMLAVISFTKMPTDLLPSIDLPYIAVVTTCPGASPEKVEVSVTKPIEGTLSATGGVEKVSSISRENYSMVIFQFSYGTNMDTAMIDMNNKLSQVKAGFDDTVGAPVMMKINPDMLPVMVASVDMGDVSEEEVSQKVSETVVPALEKVNGVASVTASGLYEKRLVITLNQEKIDALNDRLLAKVDSSLAEQRSQLEEGEKALQEARLKFETEKAKQTQDLTEKAVQVTSARTTLSSLLKPAEQLYQQLVLKQYELQAQIEALEKQLAESDMPDQAQQAALDALKSTLEETDQAVNEAKSALDDYRAQMEELEAAAAQIEAGQELLNTQLAQAEQQLTEQETALQQAKQQLDAAGDTALQSADLGGLLNQSRLSALLLAENFSMPAGVLETENGQMTVKVGDAFSDADEVGALTLIATELEGLENITIADVADVSYEDNSGESYAKVNGSNGILFTIQKQSTASTAEVSAQIRSAIERLESSNDGLNITILNDQGVYIDIVVRSVLQNLLMGGCLAILILFLFLRSVKPTLIVAVSIPISLALAVVLMYFSGVTLNIISLAGLALGVGMLVDNSIVVIENIYRLRAQGFSAVRAAVQGTKEVAGAIAASTLTTVCVFLPIVFVQGISRELFTDMGLTIAYSLLASLLVAMTLVPAVSSRVLRNPLQQKKTWFDSLANGYGRLLAHSLKHKWVVLTASVLLLALSAWGALQMGTAFIPESDSSQLSVTVEPEKDSTEEEIVQLMDTVSERVRQIEGVETVGAMLSSGSGSLYVILSENRSASSQQISKQISDAVQDLNCEVSVQGSAMAMSSLSGSGIQLNIIGDDLNQLQNIADEIGEILRSEEGVKNVVAGNEDAGKQLHITVDKNKAMSYGLTVAQVYQSVAQALTTETTATTVEQSDGDISVIVRSGSSAAAAGEDLADFELDGTKNGAAVTVRLSEIAEITEEAGASQINREDSKRYLSVTAEVDEDHNVGLVSRNLERKLEDYDLPAGYSLEFSGENETINSALGDLIWMVLLAVVLVYLIMVAQFQSFRSPFIVLFTVPLAFTGGLLLLWAGGFELSVISILGFLVLTGVVVNNGIVFVDCVNQLRAGGMERREALVMAGQQRLRPILMTAMTTILGLVTMAFGIGEGADMLQPMAVVIIGGLTYATLLTLFVVPALYDILQRRPMKTVQLEETQQPELQNL